jgi:hypothetical protein
MASLALLLGLQAAALERQIDGYLRQFENAAEQEAAFIDLVARLHGLGDAALLPVAARLAADLRDGAASPAAAALLETLSGSPESLGPLRDAFHAPATSAAGRVELAAALVQLMDTTTWREGVRGLVADPGADWPVRLHGAELLLEVSAPEAAAVFRALAAEAPRRSLAEQLDLVVVLGGAALPDAPVLLQRLAADPAVGVDVRRAALLALGAEGGPAGEEPRAVLEPEPRRGSPRRIVKKRETSEGTFSTIGPVLAGGTVFLLLLILLGGARRT